MSTGRINLWALLGAGALLAVGGIFAFRTDPPAVEGPPSEARTAAARTIRLVLSGDTQGFIVPCGCASKQFGGLPRRATFLHGLPAGDTVYVDAGGSFARAFDYDRLKAGFLWRGMALMNVAAANLGGSEIALGRRFLAEHAQTVPLLSTNVVVEDGGAPVTEAHRTVRAGGAVVTLLGICSTRRTPGEGLRVLDPKESLREPVARLRGEADLLVLLADAPEEELFELAEAYPEIDTVLATGPSQPIPPRLIAGRTVLAASANKGKFLVEIPWNPGPKGWTPGEGRIVELADTFADHPDLAALVTRYQGALREAALPPERTGEVAVLFDRLPKKYSYAGSASCLSCHEMDGTVWAHSMHAQGLKTLETKGFEADAYCLRCHTTGYGGPGGYRTFSESRLLGGIGCESCHGPSQAHVDSPRERTPVNARDACVTCHDKENSPSFVFEGYWPRIIHGKGRTPEATGSGEGH